MSSTWFEENNEVLFNSFNDYLKYICDEKSGKERGGLEVFITPYCNQACEYCYLVKNSEKLYPKDLAKPEIILNNLDILLNYLEENNYYPQSLDLYSGEIWESKLGIEVLNKILNFVKKSNKKVKFIMIPSNFSFILNDEIRPVIEEIIEAFKYYECALNFSCSYDGPIVEETNRPFVNRDTKIKTTEEYTDFLFKWCKKFGYGFHPMVNAYSIEKWEDQIKWWIKNIKDYGMDLYLNTMFLEVRNDEWTDEKIYYFLKYLNTFIDETIETFHNNDMESYIRESFRKFKTKRKGSNYNTQSFAYSSLNQGCGVDRLMTIRLGDLAWVPCHRLAYEKLVYGRLIVNENKQITGIEALNIPLFVGINSLNYKGHIKCDTCPIAKICIRGCYGTQFEAHQEIYYPCETVCNLYKAKNIFLREKLRKIYFDKNKNIPPDLLQHYNDLTAILNNLPQEEINKWITIIQTVI